MLIRVIGELMKMMLVQCAIMKERASISCPDLHLTPVIRVPCLLPRCLLPPSKLPIFCDLVEALV